MTFLPIVERELRVAARQRGTYWTRLSVAFGAAMVGTLVFLLNFQLPPDALGQYLFNGLAALALAFCFMAGRRWTADCLSEEKRDGTLGLLFLTDLKGYDVVLGKLAASSVNAFYSLLAIVPLLALPLLLGGVTAGEYGRVVLVLVNTFLFSLAVGLVASALHREARRAMSTNLLLLLVFCGMLPGVASVLVHFGQVPLRSCSPLFYTCPVFSLFLCSDGLYQAMTRDFWLSVGLTQALTWLLLAQACVAAPRCWRDQPGEIRRQRRREFVEKWSYGHPARRPAFRKQLLDVNAYYWLAGRARLKPMHVWCFLGFMVCWWLAGWFKSGELWLDEYVRIATALMLNTTLKLWIAIEAGQRLAEDRKAGAMELLLSTRLGVSDILRGQLLALRRQFFRPFLVVMALELFFLAASLRHPDPARPALPAVWAAGIALWLLDVAALIWVSMLSALRSRSASQAVLMTVSYVLLLPATFFGLATVGIAMWCNFTNETLPGWPFYVALWAGLGLVTDVVFGLSARARLRAGFRQLAMPRFAPKPARNGMRV